MVVGLDCAAPRFVFGPNAFELPTLRGIMERGSWGTLRSCDPPITVPAWSCMMTGRDPGALGIYGFRNRPDRSYAPMRMASSRSIEVPRIWDRLSKAGKRVCLLGVPQTYPVPEVNGDAVACFLAPGADSDYTYPPALKREIAEKVGDYVFDVSDFRREDKESLRADILALMRNRFDTAEYLIGSRPWDFFMLVDMGMDRLHHGFWKYCDPEHPKYVAGNRFERTFEEYYRAVDARIAELMRLAGEDTAIMVVSDHGARPLLGGFRINQWLLNEGYLATRHAMETGRVLQPADIDWSATRAWSAGGYYGRVFLNVRGREPEGIVEATDYDTLRTEIADKLAALSGPDGASMGNIVKRPEDLYAVANGVPPDLLVYFGGLSWRAVGSVGHRDIFTDENDTGPDDANHDFEGIFLYDGGQGSAEGGPVARSIYDIAPMILDFFGVLAGDAA